MLGNFVINNYVKVIQKLAVFVGGVSLLALSNFLKVEVAVYSEDITNTVKNRICQVIIKFFFVCVVGWSPHILFIIKAFWNILGLNKDEYFWFKYVLCNNDLHSIYP